MPILCSPLLSTWFDMRYFSLEVDSNPELFVALCVLSIKYVLICWCWYNIKNSYLTILFLWLVSLRFLGKVLSVERASKPTEDNKPQQTGVHLGKDFPQSSSLVKDANLTRYLNQGSRSGSIPASEPIAPRLGIDYPFPPHLEWVFPHIFKFLFSLYKKTLEMWSCKYSVKHHPLMV